MSRERIELKREESWSSGPDAEPMPTLTYQDGLVYARNALGDLYPFAPSDDEMGARGWVKKARWVSEWEDVDE